MYHLLFSIYGQPKRFCPQALDTLGLGLYVFLTHLSDAPLAEPPQTPPEFLSSGSWVLGRRGTLWLWLSGQRLLLWSQRTPLIYTCFSELQETDIPLQGAGCPCALPCSSLASVPYAQIKLWGFRSVSLVISGITQNFWSCSQAYFS